MTDSNAHADHSHHDKIFVVTFLGVLGVLVGITVVIAVIANVVDGGDGELEPIARQQIEERLAPVGDVYTDASQFPKQDVASAEASEQSPEQVVNGVCAGCHASGVLNAAKFDDTAAWQARLEAAGGTDALVQSAINGIGSMPPRGGDASLSDETIEQAVRLILERAGVN